ncbi:hypothetical protein [Aestuariivirga litoralis]|uniref:hypothetical protein n=1 Tax=Aestuariivirga litoralis TaxID=2650924 RepID=UPI0018C4A5F8|nr:hypothetical protein [Aestuariivirga litoralis]MBG1233039.1 hypothetical protein [Aestuariivirga litoralis]
MKIVSLICVAATLLFLAGCTEDNFRSAGRSMVRGACASNPGGCSMDCSAGESATRTGSCIRDPNK